MIVPRPEILVTGTAEHGGRHGIDRLPSASPRVRHDFSVCLNAFGPAPLVVQAVREAAVEEYPDPRSRVARQAAAARWNRPVSELAMGAGAAELIHAVCFAFLRGGDPVVVAQPAFGEYERAVALCGARACLVRLSAQAGLVADVSRIALEIGRVRPRLVFVATPISPTGEVLSRPAVEHLAEACRAANSLLVLDQAYDAFTASPLGTPALPGHPAVVHLRSLTKDHALAGARVAFAVGPAKVIDAIERARVPWSTTTAAQAAAVAALSGEGVAHVARTTAILRDEAERIAKHCLGLGMDVSSSSTHYMTIRCGNGGAARARLVEQNGILVRDCASFGMPEWIRVAARMPADNDALLEALAALCDPAPPVFTPTISSAE